MKNRIWQSVPADGQSNDLKVVLQYVERNSVNNILAQIWEHDNGQNKSYSMNVYKNEDELEGEEHFGTLEELKSRAEDIFSLI